MNWYVRDNDSLEVHGPMSLSDAEAMSCSLATLFPASIFDTRLSTPDMVQELLRTAKVMQGQVADFPRCEDEWLERVIVALNDLSRVPQFVTTSEVESLLRDLRGRQEKSRKLGHEVDELGELCQRAIDTITLLCCENPKPVDFSVRVLLAELQGLREAKEIIRGGEDDAIGTLLGQVMSALIHLSAKKVVRGDIHGGVRGVCGKV